MTKEIEEELARLEAENAAAPGWGAAVGARLERIKHIRASLQSPQAGAAEALIDKYSAPLYGRIVGIPDHVIRQQFSEFAEELNALASTPAPSGLAGEAVAKPLDGGAQMEETKSTLLRIHQTILSSDMRFVHPPYPDTWSSWSEAILDAAISLEASIAKTAAPLGVEAVPPSIPAGGVREADDLRLNTLSGAVEHCARIAEAIDSGRGNEKQIAAGIRSFGAALSLPAGGVAVSDAMLYRARQCFPHGDRKRVNFDVFLRAALEAALSPEAKTGERS